MPYGIGFEQECRSRHGRRSFIMASAAMKRIMREAKELRKPTDQFHAAPLDDNIFEWHFTIAGPPGTDFAGGIYHGMFEKSGSVYLLSLSTCSHA